VLDRVLEAVPEPGSEAEPPEEFREASAA